jgi:hypothetical protein
MLDRLYLHRRTRGLAHMRGAMNLASTQYITICAAVLFPVETPSSNSPLPGVVRRWKDRIPAKTAEVHSADDESPKSKQYQASVNKDSKIVCFIRKPSNIHWISLVAFPEATTDGLDKRIYGLDSGPEFSKSRTSFLELIPSILEHLAEYIPALAGTLDAGFNHHSSLVHSVADDCGIFTVEVIHVCLRSFI